MPSIVKLFIVTNYNNFQKVVVAKVDQQVQLELGPDTAVTA